MGGGGGGATAATRFSGGVEEPGVHSCGFERFSGGVDACGHCGLPGHCGLQLLPPADCVTGRVRRARAVDGDHERESGWQAQLASNSLHEEQAANGSTSRWANMGTTGVGASSLSGFRALPPASTSARDRVGHLLFQFFSLRSPSASSWRATHDVRSHAARSRCSSSR